MFVHERDVGPILVDGQGEGHSSALQLGGKSTKSLPCPRNRNTCGIQVAIGNIRYVRIAIDPGFSWPMLGSRRARVRWQQKFLQRAGPIRYSWSDSEKWMMDSTNCGFPSDMVQSPFDAIRSHQNRLCGP